jgi:hypothetical protein
MNWVKGEGVDAKDVCYAVGLGYIVINIRLNRKVFDEVSTYGLATVASKCIVIASWR